MSSHILLIGGAGYIGPVISNYLLNKGCKVTVLDSLIYNNENGLLSLNKRKNFKFFKGDMRINNDIKKAISGITDVVLLAGLVGDPITKKYPEESKSINEFGVKNCIKFFKNNLINRFIFVSTCSNYGFINESLPADEEHELNPLSSYAKAKVENEKFFFENATMHDYTPTILRFATAFGLAPRMRFDLTVNEFVSEMYHDRELIVFDADTWRPYCHVKDFARLIWRVLDAPKDRVSFNIFNAGSEENNLTKRQIVELIQKQCSRGTVKYQENGSDPRNYKVNFKKIKNQLNFEAKYSVNFGIKELLKALDDGMFKDYFQKKNIYGNYEILS